MPRKRSLAEMEAAEPPQEKEAPSMLQKIRNMWEFASVMQFIFMFGKAVKIDEDFDIEDFETECMQPGYSTKLEEIGLTLLKWISSHRGLNYDNWDEYTRRQYQAKAPNRNPYGDDEEPNKFREFDVFLKIRVLHQLTVWTFWNPDRMRERMADHPHEAQQLEWRVEEFGYGTHDYGKNKGVECQYYLLDDNRLYRRTDPPIPPPPPKATSQKAQAARRRERIRATKRRKVESETPEVDEPVSSEAQPSEVNGNVEGTPAGADVDTFNGFKWECVAITLSDYQAFCDSRKKHKDPNEKELRQRLMDEVIPTIEAAAERQKRKIERRERELLSLEKMAHAKRSSRIAGKMEREKREQEEAGAEQKRAAELAAARREKEKQDKMDQDRQSRMMTREQRIKDREFKRILAEEELVRAAEEEKRIAEGHGRGSERRLKERIAKNKKELEELNAEEEWTFDCSGCGVYGKNLDDGSHSVACEKCSVWQHSKCLGISKAAAEKSDFHFVCDDCKRKEENANQPKISLKFKMTPSPAPPSPARVRSSAQNNVSVEIPAQGHRPPSQGSMMNGYAYPPSGSSYYPARPHQYPPQQPNGYPPYPPSVQQQPYPRPQSHSSSPPAAAAADNYSHVQHYPRPSQPGQQWAPIQYAPNQVPQHAPYHQYAHQPHYSVEPRPPSSQGPQGYRPSSSHNLPNGQPTPAAGLPSAVLNRPIMSPSQGNYDVGPVAGIPQNSSFSANGSRAPPHANGATPSLHRSQYQQVQTPSAGGQAHRPKSSHSSSPPQPLQQMHLSGVSPTKSANPTSPHSHSTAPLPAPSNIPTKISLSPCRSRPSSSSSPLITSNNPGAGLAVPHARTVSGTPIIPPAEKLRPSPEQLSRMGEGTAMPTPSKVEVISRAMIDAQSQSTTNTPAQAPVQAQPMGNQNQLQGERNGETT